MTTFNIKKQKEILKCYATLLVKHWPSDSKLLREKEVYEARKQMQKFSEVLDWPEEREGGYTSLSALVGLKYNLKGEDLWDVLYDIDTKKFKQYELIDTLSLETA
jgi:hypothetical protein